MASRPFKVSITINDAELMPNQAMAVRTAVLMHQVWMRGELCKKRKRRDYRKDDKYVAEIGRLQEVLFLMYCPRSARPRRSR